MKEHRTPKSVEVVEVIKTVSLRGNGDTNDNPVREVTQYWNFSGMLIAEYDPIINEVDSNV